jgi:pimeloyl-ACP methyl ester carboxylesterase
MKARRQRLVLLPGLDGTGRLFAGFVAALPARIDPHVVAYPPDVRMSIDEHADFVVRRLPPEPVTVLAESFSGLVALALLSRAEIAVERVVFCAAFATPPRPFLRAVARLPGAGRALRTAPDVALRRYCLGADATSLQLDAMRSALSLVSPDVLAHRLRLIGTEHAFAPRTDVPCLYLQATRDRLVPARAAARFAERFTEFTSVRIDGPHLALQTRPEECAQAAARFVT